MESSDILITPEEDEISRVYVGLMAEIRERLHSVQKSRHRNISKTIMAQEYLAAEYAMLQLRMICELLAFACVAAHGDLPITRTAKFKKDYSADLIFRKLQDYHEEFFPQPVKPVETKPGTAHLEPRDDAMTRDEVVKLYRYCHDRLHRGRVEEILSWEPRRYDYEYLAASITKLHRLFEHHVIILCREDGRQAWIQMNAGGKVHWTWLALKGPVESGTSNPGK